jgi:uncharacterized protein
MKISGCWIAICFLFFSGSAAVAEQRAEVRVFFPNGEFVRAELAVSMEQREKGLMFRDGIAAEKGMLFVFEEEAIHSFWMKNVSFPIDILWLDRDRSVVHLAKRVPPCRRDPCPTYTPVRPSAYVLELRAGRSDELAIKTGDRLEFSIRR